jgi:hypothetical protein
LIHAMDFLEIKAVRVGLIGGFAVVEADEGGG